MRPRRERLTGREAVAPAKAMLREAVAEMTTAEREVARKVAAAGARVEGISHPDEVRIGPGVTDFRFRGERSARSILGGLTDVDGREREKGRDDVVAGARAPEVLDD